MIRRWIARKRRAKDKARELKWAAWVSTGRRIGNINLYFANQEYRWNRGW